MALELIRDTLKFEQLVGDGQSQALLDRDVIVPDIKPDIERVLSVEGKINITNKDVDQDRVAVDGTVNFSILYSANDESQPVYSMSHTDSFSQFINVPGAMPRMDAEIKCDFEHIDFSRINGRKFNLQCVINLKGKVKDRIPVDIVKDAGGVPDIQVLRDTVVTDDIISENTAQAVVRGTIKIPENIPPAEEILKYRAVIHKKDISVEEGKIIITGSLLIPVLFSARNEEKADLYRLEDDLVFTHTVDMPDAVPDMASNVDYVLDDVYAEVREDENGERRQIDVEAVVGLKIKATHKVEYPVIVDLYAPSRVIEPEKMDITSDLYFGRGVSQAFIKENLQLSKEHPEVEKIYDMIFQPAVTECVIEDEKIVVEGIVGCDIIYLSRGEERSVHSFSEEIPFRTSIPMPGCKTDMQPQVNVDIESAGCNIFTKDEIEVKITLGFIAELFQKVKKAFIVRAEEMEGEVPIHKASITIYMVQPKDTLWQVAKRYYTTVQDIVKVNEIADSETLTPGMKLIIPKKV